MTEKSPNINALKDASKHIDEELTHNEGDNDTVKTPNEPDYIYIPESESVARLKEGVQKIKERFEKAENKITGFHYWRSWTINGKLDGIFNTSIDDVDGLHKLKNLVLKDKESETKGLRTNVDIVLDSEYIASRNSTEFNHPSRNFSYFQGGEQVIFAEADLDSNTGDLNYTIYNKPVRKDEFDNFLQIVEKEEKDIEASRDKVTIPKQLSIEEAVDVFDVIDKEKIIEKLKS